MVIGENKTAVLDEIEAERRTLRKWRNGFGCTFLAAFIFTLSAPAVFHLEKWAWLGMSGMVGSDGVLVYLWIWVHGRLDNLRLASAFIRGVALPPSRDASA